jgi:2-keto-4-pentenoate hydratase/2-oxohepta-3-ene-1,7-dioic acid hydratase in catechol pathway
MKFRTVIDKENNKWIVVEQNNKWKRVETEFSLLDLLDKKELDISDLTLSEFQEENYQEILPFQPSAYRDFMLYEKHAIDAARGFVKKYMSNLLPIVNVYEKLFRKPFPKLKPKKRYYKYPIYYMGNHLNFISNGDAIKIPSYTEELDYELEIAAVITKPLKNASIEEVENAIGGFLILNDFSARDVQLDEMETGFGPMKTKNFGSSISSIVVSKDSILSQIENLQVKVIINNKSIIESNTKGKRYSFQEAIAYASWEEQLHPGELFGSGTIPGCTGIENGVMLKKGDIITLEVEGIGQLTNSCYT